MSVSSRSLQRRTGRAEYQMLQHLSSTVAEIWSKASLPGWSLLRLRTGSSPAIAFSVLVRVSDLNFLLWSQAQGRICNFTMGTAKCEARGKALHVYVFM
jgi:hypothetical protein